MTILPLLSQGWENFLYMIFFIGLAILLYKLMKWNVGVRESKNMDEISTKGSVIKNWIMIVCLILCAFVCFLKLVFNI